MTAKEIIHSSIWKRRTNVRVIDYSELRDFDTTRKALLSYPGVKPVDGNNNILDIKGCYPCEVQLPSSGWPVVIACPGKDY